MTPENLMRKILGATAQGNFQPLFDAIDENIVWKSASANEGPFRFGGTYMKRAGVLEVTAQMSMSFNFRRLRPKEFVSAGEVVWCLVDAEITQTSDPSKAVSFEVAIRWRVKDGKIVEHQAFFDTAHLREQMGGA